MQAIVYIHSLYFPMLTAFQIDLVLSFEELLDSLDIRHRFVKNESDTSFPNVPVTLLPQWCKKRGASLVNMSWSILLTQED